MFNVDKEGTSTLSSLVTEQPVDSLPDLVEITTSVNNTPPIDDAGSGSTTYYPSLPITPLYIASLHRYEVIFLPPLLSRLRFYHCVQASSLVH